MKIASYIKEMLGFPQRPLHPRGIGDGPGMLPYSQYEAAILGAEAHQAKMEGRRPRTAEEMGAAARRPMMTTFRSSDSRQAPFSQTGLLGFRLF